MPTFLCPLIILHKVDMRLSAFGLSGFFSLPANELQLANELRYKRSCLAVYLMSRVHQALGIAAGHCCPALKGIIMARIATLMIDDTVLP
ncbi:MAG: hypothetical protein AB1847_00480 [bacterium]